MRGGLGGGGGAGGVTGEGVGADSGANAGDEAGAEAGAGPSETLLHATSASEAEAPSKVRREITDMR